MLLCVHGVGVLLTGPAGIGKSTLALELIARGHALVADDAVELVHAAEGWVGHAPARLSGHLAVRELGILDVRAVYGARAVRARQRADFVVRLTRRRPLGARDLLEGRWSRQRIAGADLPVLSLSVGHNLATLVEAACRQQQVRP